MRTLLFAAVTMLAGLAMGASSKNEAPQRRFDVDQLLKMENFGSNVELIEDGRRMVYEWVPPYEHAPNVGVESILMTRGLHAKLYVADLEGGSGEPAPLFEQEKSGSYWIGAASPDRSKLAIYSLLGRQFRAGVFDVATRRVVWFEFTPNFTGSQERPVWISSEELVYAALPEGDLPWAMLKPNVMGRINALWERSLGGRVSSGTVLTSTAGGLQGIETARAGALMRAHARTGRATVLGEGYFIDLRLSPTGRHLAAFRDWGRFQMRDALPMGSRYRLELFDLESPSKVVVCDECNAYGREAVWSVDGSRLLVRMSRPRQDDPSDPQPHLMEYLPLTGKLRELLAPGVWLSCAGSPLPLGGSGAVVVYGQILPDTKEMRPWAKDCKREGREDWYLIRPDAPPLNLSATLKDTSPQAVGYTQDSLVMLAAGKVWRVPLSAVPRRLVPSEASLQLWDRANAIETFSLQPFPIGTDKAVLLTAERVVSLNLRDGSYRALRKPTTDVALMTFADEKAVFRHLVGHATRLSVARAAREPQNAITINSFLDSVAAAKQISLQYEFKGEKLSSCALLPPDWKPGKRYPLIVEVYPHTDGTCPSSVAALGAFYPYSYQIFPGQGYIHLSAANPYQLSRAALDDPQGNLTELILAAVDQAIKERYADPQRLGVWGMSQGHYSALKVITESNRFKAAAVSFGISNFVSDYGATPLYARIEPDAFSVGDAIRYENDFAEYGMNSNPWTNPEAYMKRSIITHADKIDTPVLIFHSDLDIFALGQSEEMFHALYRLRKPATYVTYWGEGHGVLSQANIRDMWNRTFEWYGRYLGPQK